MNPVQSGIFILFLYRALKFLYPLYKFGYTFAAFLFVVKMSKFLLSRIPKSRQYYIAVLLVIIVSTVCYLLSWLLGYKSIALVLLMTVSLIAMFFEIRPVLLAAALSALVWDFFFIPPRYTIHIGDAEDSLLLLMYFVIAMVNAALTFKIRKFEKESRLKEERANTVKLYNVLFNSLSHELKTPIATIIGASDNLMSDYDTIPETSRKSLMHEISAASIRLNQQVENLLNMSRLESGYIRPRKDWCDLSELIYSVVNQLEEQALHHKIQIHFVPNLPLFKLDYGLMEQALFNLLQNALQYTPAGTLIDIHVSTHVSVNGHFSFKSHELSSETDTVENRLIIEIMDNGIGFPEDEIDKVFDKFYRLKNSKAGGTGLGLSIVKGFIEAHDGTIFLTNLDTGGSKFIIQIPTETTYINNLKNE